MSSSSSTSSLALVAFTSFLTLLISHLAVRQDPQIIHQPISHPHQQSPPVAAPPAPPPQPVPPPPPPHQTFPPPPPTFFAPSTVLISSNGAQILYILVILVLLFGLSGLWLEAQSPHCRRSNRKLRQRKDGYVISSDSDDEDFPGSWIYKEPREQEVDEPKTWTGKMKAKVKGWEESIKLKTMSDKAKGKQKARDEEEEDDSPGKDKGKADCCGCCRILLDKCEEKEKSRQEKRLEMDKTVEQAWASQISTQDNKQLSTDEKTIETKTTSITVPSTSTSSPYQGSKGEQKSPGSAESTFVKEKAKAKATTVEADKVDTDQIVEPPDPMPERADVKLDPLTTEDTAVASVLSASGKGDSSKSPSDSKNKVSEQVTAKEDEEDKGKDKDKVEEIESTEVGPSKGKQDDGTASNDAGDEKGEGKLLKGLHVISDITKNITEEVLKQVLAHLDGQEGVPEEKAVDESLFDTTKTSGPSSDFKRNSDFSDAKNKSSKKDPAPQEKDQVLEAQVTAKESSTEKSEESKDVGKKSEVIKGESSSQIGSIVAGQEAKPKNDGKREDEKDDKKDEGGKNKNDDKIQAKPDVPQSTSATEKAPKEAAAVTASPQEKGKGKGKEKEKEETTEQVPTINPEDCEPVLESAIQVLLQALKDQTTGKDLYYKTADHLAGSYPSIVTESSGNVRRSLDEEFVSAFNTQNVKVKIPWYSYKDGANDTEPHQDGKEPEALKESVKKAVKESESKSDKEDREAIMRALDLWHVYKEECDKEKADALLKKEERASGKAVPTESKKETPADADGMLQSIIESLLQTKQEDQERSAKIKEWTDRVAVEAVESDAPSKSTSGYPNVIPLEAVNASSLARAGVWNKHQQQYEKQARRSEALKSAALDTRKNFSLIKDDLVVDIREGASSKAKALKGLLKKKTVANNENDKERPKEKSPRKSVRLQDAAGRGEGPQDVSRGETEQEARYRRLREMASRLND